MRREIEWSKDIGMFNINRSIPESCVHATDHCRAGCYNNKLYRAYPAMVGKDARNEEQWHHCTGEDVAKALKAKKHQTRRARLMGRGEAFKTCEDIARVVDIAKATPATLWWVPTRGWRDPAIRALIERHVMPLANVVVLASTDPTNTQAEEDDLTASGWSLMYFGDDAERPGWFKCPKTWKGIKGHCSTCKAGCFAPRVLDRQVKVHLKSH